MLKNLQAEITRSGITSEQLSVEIGVTVRTLRNKISGVTEFQRDEMFKIRDTFFPDLGVEYLFLAEPKLTCPTCGVPAESRQQLQTHTSMRH